jgi:hypothetical protein
MTSATHTPPETIIDQSQFEAYDFGDPGNDHPQTQADIILSLADPHKPAQVAELQDFAGDYRDEVGEIIESVIRLYTMRLHPAHIGKLALEAEAERPKIPELINVQGYVKKPTRIQDQILEITRTAPFKFNGLKPHMESNGLGEKETTEIDGLRDLRAFLRNFLQNAPQIDNTYGQRTESKKIAKGILDDLTFIGASEFQEATSGLAFYWRDYLDADPENKICVITNISDSEKYKGKRKSDAHLKTKILDHYTHHDLVAIGDRLVFDVESLGDAVPEKTKIILLDDWALSGRQMFRVLKNLYDNPAADNFHDSIEANFVIATGDRLKHGLSDPDKKIKDVIKTKAIFKAYPSASAKYGARITGLHCTTNFDFGDDIWKLSDLLNKAGADHTEIPALASVVREYKLSQANGQD